MCSLTDVKCLSEPSVTSELYQPKQLMIRSCFWSAEPVFSDTATAECGNKEKTPWFCTDYVAVTRALSLNAKVLIYWSIWTLFLFSTAVMRITSRIQALEKGFLWRVPRLNFGVSVAAPPHWNEPFEAVWASDLNSSWTPPTWRVSGTFYWEEASWWIQDLLERLYLSVGLGIPRCPGQAEGGMEKLAHLI